MKKPIRKPTVKLIGKDGNAFSIMGRVRKALLNVGADEEYVNTYIEKCISSDNYDTLLTVTMEYIDVI